MNFNFIKRIKDTFTGLLNISIPVGMVGDNLYNAPYGTFWLQAGDYVQDNAGNSAQILTINCNNMEILPPFAPPIIINIQSVIGSLSDVDRFLNNNNNVNRFIWCVENFEIRKNYQDAIFETKLTYFIFERYEYQALNSSQHYDILAALESFNEYLKDYIQSTLGYVNNITLRDFNRASILTNNLEKVNIIEKAYTGIMVEINIKLKDICC